MHQNHFYPYSLKVVYVLFISLIIAQQGDGSIDAGYLICNDYQDYMQPNTFKQGDNFTPNSRDAYARSQANEATLYNLFPALCEFYNYLFPCVMPALPLFFSPFRKENLKEKASSSFAFPQESKTFEVTSCSSFEAYNENTLPSGLPSLSRDSSFGEGGNGEEREKALKEEIFHQCERAIAHLKQRAQSHKSTRKKKRLRRPPVHPYLSKAKKSLKAKNILEAEEFLRHYYNCKSATIPALQEKPLLSSLSAPHNTLVYENDLLTDASGFVFFNTEVGSFNSLKKTINSITHDTPPQIRIKLLLQAADKLKSLAPGKVKGNELFAAEILHYAVPFLAGPFVAASFVEAPFVGRHFLKLEYTLKGLNHLDCASNVEIFKTLSSTAINFLQNVLYCAQRILHSVMEDIESPDPIFDLPLSLKQKEAIITAMNTCNRLDAALLKQEKIRKNSGESVTERVKLTPDKGPFPSRLSYYMRWERQSSTLDPEEEDVYPEHARTR